MVKLTCFRKAAAQIATGTGFLADETRCARLMKKRKKMTHKKITNELNKYLHRKIDRCSREDNGILLPRRPVLDCNSVQWQYPSGCWWWSCLKRHSPHTTLWWASIRWIGEPSSNLHVWLNGENPILWSSLPVGNEQSLPPAGWPPVAYDSRDTMWCHCLAGWHLVSEWKSRNHGTSAGIEFVHHKRAADSRGEMAVN